MSIIRQSFETKAIIYTPFTKKPQVFTLVEGYVSASTIDDEGKNRIHLIYGPGAYFPVLSILRGSPQRATYTALSNVVLESESAVDFLSRLDSDSNFCRLILQKTVDQMALFAERVIDLQLTKLTDRIERKLHILALGQGVVAEGGRELPYVLRHHHLADMLGVERESVSRALSALVAQKRIAVLSDGRFFVPSQ